MKRFGTNKRKDKRIFSRTANFSKPQNDIGYRLGQRGGQRM
ncbi:MAG: hypothetical protein [Arizlama microvirus]|nr:MAG: hypothetical protein [Arizlama microvirus]